MTLAGAYSVSRRLGARVRWEVASRRRRTANLVRLLGWARLQGPARSTLRFGPVPAADSPHVPVVMCIWQRVDRLQRTIDTLEREPIDGLVLHLWNNNRAAQTEIEAIVRSARRLPIVLTHSSRNVGGFGRFYLARELAATCPYVLFLDDDLAFERGTLARLLSEARPESIASQWAFTLSNATDYFDRVPVAPGARADYCGTGGMVADSSIFTNDRLFACPHRFWFIEDLWLSYVAEKELGWSLTKSHTRFVEDGDGADQFVLLSTEKSSFLGALVRSGWMAPGYRQPTAAQPSMVQPRFEQQ